MYNFRSLYVVINNYFKLYRIKYFILILLVLFFSCAKDEGVNLDSTEVSSNIWDIPIGDVIDGGGGKDGIPSINNPKFVSIEDTDYIQSTDLVLLLNVGEITHIYPHKILDYHEAINDVIGENNTAITYCPLTGTGIGFNGLINGSKTTFGISGLVYKNNQILFDRLTESFWSQISRKSVHGDLRGRTAKTVTLFETTWETAKSLAPDALVLSEDTGFNRSYDQFPYLDYRTNDEFFIFPVDKRDDRLPAKERVYSILGSTDVKTYTLSSFDDNISLIKDSFEGKLLLLIGSQKHHFITAFIREAEKEYTLLQDEFPLIMEDNNGTKYDIFGKTPEELDNSKRLKQPNAMMGYWFSLVDFFGRPQIYSN